MNPSSRLRQTIRRLTMIVLLAVVGGAAGATYAAVKTPSYTATAYVVASAPQGDAATALNFAQAYGRIATSGPVLATARGHLSDGSGLSSVRSATSPDAPVVEIVASGTDARHTADLANAVARGLADYASLRSKDTNVKLSVLAPATVPARPTSPKPPLELAIGAAAGLLIGGLIALGSGSRGEPQPGPAHAGRLAYDGRAPMPARPARRVAMSVSPVPVATDRVVGRAPVDEAEDRP